MHKSLPDEQGLVSFSKSDCPQSDKILIHLCHPKYLFHKEDSGSSGVWQPSRTFCIKIQVLLCLCTREAGHRVRGR